VSKYKCKPNHQINENATFHRSQNHQELTDQSVHLRAAGTGDVAGILYPGRAAMERKKATHGADFAD
jgi:hypothetical protein